MQYHYHRIFGAKETIRSTQRVPLGRALARVAEVNAKDLIVFRNVAGILFIALAFGVEHDEAFPLFENLSHIRKAATLAFALAGTTNHRNVRLTVIRVLPAVFDIHHRTGTVHWVRGFSETCV